MGFLKFLKREKKKDEFDELDLPPAPPPLEDFDENSGLPEFPDIGEDISGIGEMPKFDFPEKEEKMPDFDTEDNLPEFPSFPAVEEKPVAPVLPFRAMPKIPESTLSPTPQIPQPAAEPEQQVDMQEQPMNAEEMPGLSQDAYPKTGRRLFRPERTGLRGIPRAKTIYVRIDKFKATLGSINLVRSNLKKSEEALAKLESIKNAKDKSFDKMKSSLDDLQKKLIFVDGVLFKGE